MPPIRILIINPNTDQSMTDSLREPIESLGYNNTTYTYLTSPLQSSSSHGIASINSPADALASATHTLPAIVPLIRSHDAFLIACFSPHPLVGLVRGEIEKEKGGITKPVLGIMEASVLVAMGLVATGEGMGGGGNGNGGKKGERKRKRFGIVSTGLGWKSVLEGAVGEMFDGSGEGEDGADTSKSKWFKGVECCGIDAGDLHADHPPPATTTVAATAANGNTNVENRVRSAVKRLVQGDVEGDSELGVVILGCAGMVGMEKWVREEVESGVRVVDGVKAGVGMLQGVVRGGF